MTPTEFDPAAPLPPLKPFRRKDSWEPAARRYRDLDEAERAGQAQIPERFATIPHNDEPDHPALADPEGIALVKAIHDRKNGQAEKVGPSSAMAERGRRGGESSDRVGGHGDGGR